jgi:hypothetical protein
LKFHLFPDSARDETGLSGGRLAPVDDLKSRGGQFGWRHDDRVEICGLSFRALALPRSSISGSSKKIPRLDLAPIATISRLGTEGRAEG